MRFIDADIPTQDYVYIIANDKDYIKVGISKDPNKRVKQLQTGNPNKLKLLFTEEFECKRDHLLKIEKLIHKSLSPYKEDCMGEWFKIDMSKLQEIKNIIVIHRIQYDANPLAFKFR